MQVRAWAGINNDIADEKIHKQKIAGSLFYAENYR